MQIEMAKLQEMLAAEAEMAATWDDLSEKEKKAYLSAHPTSKHHTKQHSEKPVNFGEHLAKYGWESQGKGMYKHKKNGRTLKMKSGESHTYHLEITHPNGDVTTRKTNWPSRAGNVIRRWGLHTGPSTKSIDRSKPYQEMLKQKMKKAAPAKAEPAKKPMVEKPKAAPKKPEEKPELKMEMKAPVENKALEKKAPMPKKPSPRNDDF